MKNTWGRTGGAGVGPGAVAPQGRARQGKGRSAEEACLQEGEALVGWLRPGARLACTATRRITRPSTVLGNSNSAPAHGAGAAKARVACST